MKKESKSEASNRKCGATFLEYALLLALVGIVAAVGVKYYGESISKFFTAMGDKTSEVTPTTSSSTSSSIVK